MGWPYFWN